MRRLLAGCTLLTLTGCAHVRPSDEYIANMHGVGIEYSEADGRFHDVSGKPMDWTVILKTLACGASLAGGMPAGCLLP